MLRPKLALAVLFAIALFNYIDRALPSILQIPMKKELGLSDAQMGAITGLSFALVYATAAIPLARLVDLRRRTWIMAWALSVWASLLGFPDGANRFGLQLRKPDFFRVGVALGEPVSVPATLSLLSNYFPRRLRGTVISIWALAPPLGIMLGIFGGGWLAHHIGWRLSFLVIGTERRASERPCS